MKGSEVKKVAGIKAGPKVTENTKKEDEKSSFFFLSSYSYPQVSETCFDDGMM